MSSSWAPRARPAPLYLDAYEKTVDQVIEAELKLAGYTKQEWLTSLIEAHG